MPPRLPGQLPKMHCVKTEIIHDKYLEQRPAHSKCSINANYHYYLSHNNPSIVIVPALSGRKLELSEGKSLPSQLQLVNEGLRI